MSGYIGVRRLRPRVRCMLLTSAGTTPAANQSVGSRSSIRSTVTGNSILEHYGERGTPARADLIPTDGGMEIVLQPGQVGNQSMFDIARQTCSRRSATAGGGR